MNAITPGEGWRLLNKGEILREGDEVAQFNNSLIGYRWLPIASWLVGDSCFFPSNFRRRTSDWISRSERLPTREDCDSYGCVLASRSVYKWVWNTNDLTQAPPDFWCKLPPDPVIEPKPDTADEAFEARWKNVAFNDTGKAGFKSWWNAGVEWQKKQTQNQTPQ